MNKNKLSSLTNLSRKETDFCSKIWKCLFWLEGSCLFLVEEIKKLLFREQTLHLLLFLIPQSAVPKNSSPPHSDLLLILLRKCIVEEKCHFTRLLHCIHLWWSLQGGFRLPKNKDTSEPMMEYWMALQSKVYSDTLFNKQVMHEEIQKGPVSKIL